MPGWATLNISQYAPTFRLPWLSSMMIYMMFMDMIWLLVGGIYGQGLMILDIDPSAGALVVFLAPFALVLANPKKSWLPQHRVMLSLVVTATLCRVILVPTDAIGRIVLSAIGVFLLFIYFGYQFSVARYHEHNPDVLGFGTAILLTICFRTLGVTMNLSLDGWWQVLGWVLAVITIAVTASCAIEDASGPQTVSLIGEENCEGDPTMPLRWTFLSAFVWINCILMAILGFATPAALARWSGTNYEATCCLSVIFHVSIVYATYKWDNPMDRWPKWVHLIFNSVFCIFATMASAEDIAESSHFQQALMYLSVVLSPLVSLCNMGLATRCLLDKKHKSSNVALSFGLAGLWFNIIIFASICSIIYAYVDGIGPVFRDRWWLIILLVTAGAGLPSVLLKYERPERTNASVAAAESRGRDPHRGIGFVLVSALFLTITGVFLLAPNAPTYTPSSVTATELRVLTYNIQQGYDLDARLSYNDQLAILLRSNADIIGLQESETARVTAGNFDTVRFFASHLNMYSYYGPKTIYGTYGIALLSKYPILDAQTHYLPSEGEQVAALSAVVQIGNQTLSVFVTHYGTEPADLIAQSTSLSKLMAEAEPPADLMMCDCNMEPFSGAYNHTTASIQDSWLRLPNLGPGYTDLWTNATQRIDYIFSSSRLSPKSMRVLTTARASDHMPVLGVFNLTRAEAPN